MFLRRNGLSLCLLALTIFFIGCQIYAGLHAYNDELREQGQPTLLLSAYLHSPHLMSALFENWESEFLQMALLVWLTIFLRQKGSSESKKIDEDIDVDREPSPGKSDAPWAVRRSGMWLKMYNQSLTITLFILFILSFILHVYGSLKDTNTENKLRGQPLETWQEYLTDSRLWFESLQNWQSEFLSVFAIIVFIHIPQAKRFLAVQAGRCTGFSNRRLAKWHDKRL